MTDIRRAYGTYDASSVGTWNASAAKRELRDDLMMRDVMIRWFRRPGRVLEVGSAVGQWVARLQRFGFEAMGSDIVPDFVAEMKRKGLRAELWDATDLPQDQNGQWDNVLGVGLSPQMDKTVPGATEATFRSIHRVLKPGGHYLSVCGTYDWGRLHMRAVYRSREEHIQAIQTSGLFKLLHVQPYQITPARAYRQWNAPFLHFFDKHLAWMRPNVHLYVIEKI